MSGVAIGIDVGTSGVRAALVNAAGTPLAWGAAPLAAERRREPEAWWRAVERALDALRAADLSGVRALAVDGTSGTVLPVDAGGRPLGPACMYNDKADPALVARVTAAAPQGSAAHGATSPLAKLLVLQNIPDVAKILHQADWIAGRLCGRFDVSDENNALKTGYDPVARRWPGWLGATGVRTGVYPISSNPERRLHPSPPKVQPVLACHATRASSRAPPTVAPPSSRRTLRRPAMASPRSAPR